MEARVQRHPGPAQGQSLSSGTLKPQSISGSQQSTKASAVATPSLAEEGDYFVLFFYSLLLFAGSSCLPPRLPTRPSSIMNQTKLHCQIAQDSCLLPRASLITGPESAWITPHPSRQGPCGMGLGTEWSWLRGWRREGQHHQS